MVILCISTYSMSQWKYDDYADTMGKDMYSMAINKNLMLVKSYEDITLSLNDSLLANGHRNVKLTFLMSLGSESYITTGKISNGVMVISNRLDKERFLSVFKYCSKLQVEIIKNTHYKGKKYFFHMENTPQTYEFIITH